MSSPTPLKLALAEDDWCARAGQGRLSGQMSTDELVGLLSGSEFMQNLHGSQDAAQKALEGLSQKQLEAQLVEVERHEPLDMPAAGRMRGLGWADGTIARRHPPFQRVDSPDGVERFQHIPYGYFLPPLMVTAAQESQQRGEPTVLESNLLLFAWVEWLIATRGKLWSANSPMPELLAVLVEAFGIEAELHREDPAKLMRLVARLPTWYPHRGSIERALQLLEETLGLTLPITAVSEDSEQPLGQALTVEEEVLSCRGADWWQQRRSEGAAHVRSAGQSAMRIQDGMLRFQSMEQDVFPLVREDILVSCSPNEPFPTVLTRVLPAWVSLRVVALDGDA